MVSVPFGRTRVFLGAVAGVLLGVGASGGIFWFLQPPPSVTGSRFERGRREAERLGCFLCHGPDGRAGTTNFIPELDEVPSWSQGNFAAYVKAPEEVREWILDGSPARMLADPAEVKRIEGLLIKMPAYRGFVSYETLSDLEFYVTASGLLLPQAEDSPEGRGRAVMVRLGCFGCHGAEGRGRAHNEGSLKGYIPAWDSADYLELVESPQELREWVLDGVPKRLSSNPAASYFLTRQVVKMPAYRGQISAEELEDLVTYLGFLRARP